VRRPDKLTQQGSLPTGWFVCARLPGARGGTGGSGFPRTLFVARTGLASMSPAWRRLRLNCRSARCLSKQPTSVCGAKTTALGVVRCLTFELRRPARRAALGPRRTMEPATALRGPRAARLVGSPLERGVRQQCSHSVGGRTNLQHSRPASQARRRGPTASGGGTPPARLARLTGLRSAARSPAGAVPRRCLRRPSLSLTLTPSENNSSRQTAGVPFSNLVSS
jgi:hypothetical protein